MTSFGQDCPADLVQVETVITDGVQDGNGWNPGRTLHIDIYIGGRRFLILAGEAAVAYGSTEPGLLVVADAGIEVKKQAINSASLTLDKTGEKIHEMQQERRKRAAITPR